MFKYTPPWQVLCNSLENDMKRKLTFAPSSQHASGPLNRSYPFSSPPPPPPPPPAPPPPTPPAQPQSLPFQTPTSTPTPSCSSPEAEPQPQAEPHSSPMESSPTPSMVSKPRKWVMKPMSPRLELSELRNMVSPTSEDSFSFSSSSILHHQQGAPLDSQDFQGISITRSQTSISVSSRSDVEDVVVVSRQVAVKDTPSPLSSRDVGDAWSVGSGRSTPSTCPGTPSSAGSHMGFYSFVEDPTSPEAEKNEEWMVSPERQSKLATLKQQDVYKLQTYAPERKPERLFEENNGDSRYRVENSIVSRTMAKDGAAKVDRKEIIRDQAPKKGRAFKEQYSSLESLDLTSGTRKLMDGFSISYRSASPATEPTPAEPGTIDEKQIDFDSARKQFLLLEQTKRSPIIRRAGDTTHSPAPTSTSTYTPNSPAPTHVSQVPAQLRKYMFYEESVSSPSNEVAQESRTTTETDHRLSSPTSGEDVFVSNVVTVTVTEDQKAMRQRMTRGSAVELDSGLGEQLGGNTSDSSDSSSDQETAPGERDTPVAQETPIEREIRITQEREESLRKSRGIRHSSSTEMVEIKTKPLLLLNEPTPPPVNRPLKAKDGNRVSFLIQREISRDLERQDSIGSVENWRGGGGSVIYDVEERKKVFETQVSSSPVLPVFSAALPDVSQSSSSVVGNSSWITKQPALTETPEEEGLAPCCPHRHSPQSEYTVLPVSRASSTSTSSSESSWGSRNRQSTAAGATETQRMSFPAGVRPRPASLVRAEGQTRASMGAFSSSSLSSLTDLGKDQENPSLPQWKKDLDERLQNAPDLIRQEIERDMQREQEYVELRESRIRSMSLDTGLDDVDNLETTVTVTTQQTRAEEPDRPKQSFEEEYTTLQTSVIKVQEPPKESVLPEEPIKPVSSRTSYSWSVDNYSTRRIAASDNAFHTPSARPYSRLPSVSIVTAQPWGNTKPSSPAAPRGSSLVTAGSGSGSGWAVRSVEDSSGPLSPVSPQKGLTETLLQGFSEHRAKLKMEENAYAGIQPIDDVNHEVLESTRVTRHKNTRALRWEAGVYSNEDGD